MLINEMLAQGKTVTLCKQGEYGIELSFDFSCWEKQFGSGSVGWTFRRSQDASAYLLPDTEEGTVSTITLSATETQYAGMGKLEVFFVNDGETEKRISETLNFTIAPSLQDLGEVPSPWESYVDAVHEDAVAAEEARQSAEDSATSASESAQSAQEALQSLEDMTATASVGDTYGAPRVEVEKTMVDDHVNLDFDFKNLRGNGIESVSLLSTSGLSKTYRITFSDGSYFDYSLADGNGIASAVLNADYTLTLTFTDGTSYTTPSIRGEKGEKGDKGDKGEVDAESLLDVIGLSIVDGKLCITYEGE